MRIFYLLILIIFQAACSREKTFEFIVENNTIYKIDLMEIGDVDLDVLPNSKSGPVFVNYKSPWGLAMSEPLLVVAVRKYSDSIITYENNHGRVIPISDLDKNSTNIITLELDTPAQYENDIFKIKLID